MKTSTPKYFHYFLACVFLDSIILFLIFQFIYPTARFDCILATWIIANFMNYPRLATRRYISYYQLFVLSIRQLITFYLIYLLLFTFVGETLKLLSYVLVWPVFTILLGRILFVFILRFYRVIGKGYNRFILIGQTPVMLQLEKRFLSKKSYGYILEAEFPAFEYDTIKKLIVERHINEIYCSSRSVNQNDLSKLLTFTFAYGVNVHVVSDNHKTEASENLESFELEFSDPDIENYPLIDQKNLIIKRIFDLVFSALIILAVLSWLTPLLWIIIKIESPGPVFFKQPRAGRNGKYFTCLKFRSMRQNTLHNQATPNDPRITKVGRIIRKLSIDEFPQFINVLIGDMSVVGPRPHIKDLNDKYDQTVNNYNDRILVKPGITGLSQITGHRGETKGNASMTNRIRIDILYIKSWTLSLDLVIIFKTVVDVLFGKSKNAY